MASHESKEQRGTVERVMHEYKEGELRTGRGKGPKVKSRRQAVAIALQEAGATNRQSAAENRASLRRTKSKERQGETAEAEKEGKRAQEQTVHKGESRGGETKSELYAKARARHIEGRSKMSKAQLQRALSH
jgi:Family of unknown function (DUF6496)